MLFMHQNSDSLFQTYKSVAFRERIEPYSKHLEDGIFELRAQQGNNIARTLYFFRVGQRIVITNGFIKKTQKTPKKELELAKKTGIDQSDISKIETGNANPALSTLKRLAEGMDMVLRLEFIPKNVIK